MRSAARKCSFCVDNGMECTYSGAPTTTVSPPQFGCGLHGSRFSETSKVRQSLLVGYGAMFFMFFSYAALEARLALTEKSLREASASPSLHFDADSATAYNRRLPLL